MAPHDSDSSGDEQDEYTETNVLLGYASKEPEDISRLGGRPVRPVLLHRIISHNIRDTDKLTSLTLPHRRNGSTQRPLPQPRSPGAARAGT